MPIYGVDYKQWEGAPVFFDPFEDEEYSDGWDEEFVNAWDEVNGMELGLGIDDEGW